MGSVKVCDDGNPCTADSCNPFVAGGCVTTPKAGSCDDGNVCTLGDTCADGSCVAGAGALDCNDDNECTTDTCQPATGCKHVNLVGFCDDGNSCTQGDYCANGQCISGANACPCATNADCALQDDGDLCNGILKCDKSNPSPALWICKVDPASVVNCSAGTSPCADQVCVPQTGQCVSEAKNEGGACDDGDKCTQSDTCHNGLCLGGAPLVCNDGNECTADACLKTQGCVHSPVANGTPCGLQGWYCQSSICTHCNPACGGKECGSDGCNGSCGTCGAGETCTAQGQCISSCVGCAPWQSCVNGVCQDPAPTGTCPYGGEMLGTFCHDIGLAGCCGGPDDLYYCGWNQECPWGMGSCLCHIECAGTQVCGFDYDNNYYNCTWPPAQPNPWGEKYCSWYVCEPDCTGKVCGDDGCGGSCGTCSGDKLCVNGACQAQGLTSCNGLDTWSYSSCQGLDFIGCCDAWGRVLWCDNNKLYCIDCATIPSCGWDSKDGFYDCLTPGGSDPSGQYPKTCPCIPPCPSGYSCINGKCK